MRALSESEGLLVIQGPNGLGLLLIAIAIVVALAAVALARKVRRPVRLGAFLVSIALLYFGWHLVGTKTTLESRGYYVESIYGEEQRMGWLQVSDIAPTIAGVKANPDHLVLLLRNSNEAVIDLSGLAPEEKARITAYVRQRLKALSR
jgi:hypothetical protein